MELDLDGFRFAGRIGIDGWRRSHNTSRRPGAFDPRPLRGFGRRLSAHYAVGDEGAR